MRNKTIKIRGNVKRIARMLSINNIFHIDNKRFDGLKTKQNLK